MVYTASHILVHETTGIVVCFTRRLAVEFVSVCNDLVGLATYSYCMHSH